MLARRLVGLTDLPARGRLPRMRPASPPMLAASLRSPWPPRPGKALAGLLPPGTHSTEPIGDRIRALHDGRRWPEDPLWVCAVRMGDGRRVVFGRDQ